jgi:hypothetical protein
MAAIDKIYINWETYCKFKEWCEKQPPLYDKYGKEIHLKNCLRNCDEKDFVDKDGKYCTLPIMSNQYYVDAYIIRNCPIEEIQKELMLNYGYWSQERIREYYEDVKNWSGEGECPYWAKLDDFIFNDDGTITLKGLGKSSYEKIKDNELYTLPYRENVEYGKHFKMISSPSGKKNSIPYNKPFKGVWHIDIENTNNPYDFMHYNESTETWDFFDEFVISDWVSSTAYVKTIKALKRKIRKWKLPIGAKVIATGYFIKEKYEFVVI